MAFRHRRRLKILNNFVYANAFVLFRLHFLRHENDSSLKDNHVSCLGQSVEKIHRDQCGVTDTTPGGLQCQRPLNINKWKTEKRKKGKSKNKSNKLKKKRKKRNGKKEKSEICACLWYWNHISHNCVLYFILFQLAHNTARVIIDISTQLEKTKGRNNQDRHRFKKVLRLNVSLQLLSSDNPCDLSIESSLIATNLFCVKRRLKEIIQNSTHTYMQKKKLQNKCSRGLWLSKYYTKIELPAGTITRV